MSVEVDKNKIKMTRGDTLRVKVEMFEKSSGDEYIPQEGDSIRFAVKHPDLTRDLKEYVDKTPLILKTISKESQILVLHPEDTKPLGFGKYDYDIQITFSDGTVDTFISGTLQLTKEVE